VDSEKGTGFVTGEQDSSAPILLAAQRGHRVRVLDNPPRARRKICHCQAILQYRNVEGDIRDQTACKEAMKGIEYVFHQAALFGATVVEDPQITNAVTPLEH
jgi:nucleoside-diphosphate-sugar epimerase